MGAGQLGLGKFPRDEIDYRTMTRETWRRARASFDRAYEEFRACFLQAWDKLEDEA